MKWIVRNGPLAGSVSVPGDKSIAHRALMFAGIADGTSTIRGLPDGEDVRSTARCMQDLGCRMETDGDASVVHGPPALRAPGRELDAGNSGTTMRLLAGILAGQPFDSCLTGDESLRARPMKRIAEPLNRMGAAVVLTDGRAPISIEGGDLAAIRYAPPVASAQVKSCVLLAGLFAYGTTEVIEPVKSRDHTERMLRGLGVEVGTDGLVTSIEGGQRPEPFDLEVPGDISSAAFFLAAAALAGTSLAVHNVGVNPTRTGLLVALGRMGVSVRVDVEREDLGEPAGTVAVEGRVAEPITIEAEDVPAVVDELPLVALLATQANGRSVIRGAGELRVKETDRIAAVAASLTAMGARIEEREDGFIIEGPTPLHGARVESRGDHRIAMMLAVAGSIAEGETVIEGAEAARISFPTFVETFRHAGGVIDHA